jgi:signal transduction histidine kinase
MSREKRLGTLILIVSLLIVVVSVLFTNNLARRLAEEEQKKVEMWVEATRLMVVAPEDADLSMELAVIQSNTSIPVYLVDSAGTILSCANVTDTVADPRTLNGPIVLELPGAEPQYIYYAESTLLRQLRYVPYLQFSLIFIFILVAVIMLLTAHHSEQNRVWAGLSRETAHQLGTPISSLMACQEILAERYPEDDMLPLLRNDVSRLSMIADRFSKIGSEPELEPVRLTEALEESLTYMRTRVSNKVEILNRVPEDSPVVVELNRPLFAWVIENLVKNAVDAMDGQGTITISTETDDDEVHVLVQDTGRGMDAATRRQVFQAGFTTKKRGWGLGLTLAKRIIEDYHGGSLLLRHSRPGQGTTFAVVLKQAKHR